jgi:uncharacterized protein (DUF433 family)
LLKRVTIDPQVCHGKPCIRGLRYPVTMLLELMSSGMPQQDILSAAEHDALHTLDLPLGNATSDAELCEVCVREQ